MRSANNNNPALRLVRAALLGLCLVCGAVAGCGDEPGSAASAASSSNVATQNGAGAGPKTGATSAKAADPDSTDNTSANSLVLHSAQAGSAAASGAADVTTASSDATGSSTEPTPVGSDNAWKAPTRPAPVDQGDRVYVMTRGRDRTYTDAKAVYQLYAYDVASAHGDNVTLQELGGGRFTVSGLFVIPAGTTLKKLRKGDMVLAEWASTLKHGIVTGFEGDKVKVRYTDLPESWAQEKVSALRDARELSKQQDGFHPGNFAIADKGAEKHLVMLVSEAAGRWLVRGFAGRISSFSPAKLRPIPIKPKIRRRQKVQVPWIGIMYSGQVVKIVGPRALVKVPGIGQDQPISVPLGQLVALSR